MGQFRETKYKVDLAATGDPSGGDVVRVWDAPIGEPFRNMTIVVSSNGEIIAGNNLDWDVLYGGGWTATPFDEDSTHLNGVSQGTGNIGAGEVFAVIYEDASILPANRKYLVPVDRSSVLQGVNGGAVVLKLTNKKAGAISVYVTFLSETITEA